MIKTHGFGKYCTSCFCGKTWFAADKTSSFTSKTIFVASSIFKPSSIFKFLGEDKTEHGNPSAATCSFLGKTGQFIMCHLVAEVDKWRNPDWSPGFLVMFPRNFTNDALEVEKPFGVVGDSMIASMWLPVLPRWSGWVALLYISVYQPH